MTKNLILLFLAGLLMLAGTEESRAVGEDILAHTGQYTFFIKPYPSSFVTFYQKMVPCLETKMVPFPRRVVQTFPVPVPAVRGQRVAVTETPVGHAKGVGPCVECWPSPSARPGMREFIEPMYLPVSVPGVEFQPRPVTRRLMLPQWFAVEEHPVPPKKVRKVSTDG
jgi:hypothetical protein